MLLRVNVFFLLLLFTTVKSDVCTELNTTASTPLTMVNTLWTWCLEDSECADLFYQENPNITVFSFLAKPIALLYQSLDTPFEDLFCNVTKDDAVKNVWLLLLKSMIDSMQICDINHILVVDIDELTTDCICKGDKVCKNLSDHLTLLFVMSSGFLVISVAVMILLSIDIWARISLYHVMKNSKGTTKDVTIKISNNDKKKKKKDKKEESLTFMKGLFNW
jgi:hypothetical protein